MTQDQKEEGDVCIVCGQRIRTDPSLPQGLCSVRCACYYEYCIISLVNYYEQFGWLPHSDEELNRIYEAYDWILKYRHLWKKPPVPPIL